MNAVKNFTTIHLRLNQIDVLEVVILLMTYWWWNMGSRSGWVWALVNICISFVFPFTAMSHAFFLYINPSWSPALDVKIYEFPWWRLLFACLHLANLSCHFPTCKCNPSWYFDDVKFIVLSLRSAPNQTLSRIYHDQEA